MTLFIRTAILILVLATAHVAAAQDARIAVVDLQRLTIASDEGKKVSERLDKRYQEIAGTMQKAQKDLEDKQAKLKSGERLMSETAKAQLTREIEQASRELTRKNEDYQRELQELEQQLMGPVMAHAEATLGAYVKEQAFTILFNLSAENGTLVWTNKANDITDDVLKKMNAESKASAVPAAAPSAPAAAPPAAATPKPTK